MKPIEKQHAVKTIRKRNWAVRKIKHGEVRIAGKVFRPDENRMEYDGRLDGLRYVFGRYWTYTVDGGIVCNPYICLWGSEAEFKSSVSSNEVGPEVVDGQLPWLWWREVKEEVS